LFKTIGLPTDNTANSFLISIGQAFVKDISKIN
jgi:hypothetical protein